MFICSTNFLLKKTNNVVQVYRVTTALCCIGLCLVFVVVCRVLCWVWGVGVLYVTGGWCFWKMCSWVTPGPAEGWWGVARRGSRGSLGLQHSATRQSSASGWRQNWGNLLFCDLLDSLHRTQICNYIPECCICCEGKMKALDTFLFIVNIDVSNWVYTVIVQQLKIDN